MLSRSCNAEQALKMSLGKNWEGKASYEAEPEELPEIKAIKKSCDGQELVSKEYYAFQFVFMRTEKRFFCFLLSLQAKLGQLSRDN